PSGAGHGACGPARACPLPARLALHLTEHDPPDAVASGERPVRDLPAPPADISIDPPGSVRERLIFAGGTVPHKAPSPQSPRVFRHADTIRRGTRRDLPVVVLPTVEAFSTVRHTRGW